MTAEDGDDRLFRCDGHFDVAAAPGRTPLDLDEPFFVLRGNDRHFASMLTCYEMMLRDDGTKSKPLRSRIRKMQREAIRWQEQHAGRVKAPTL